MPRSLLVHDGRCQRLCLRFSSYCPGFHGTPASAPPVPATFSNSSALRLRTFPRGLFPAALPVISAGVGGTREPVDFCFIAFVLVLCTIQPTQWNTAARTFLAGLSCMDWLGGRLCRIARVSAALLHPHYAKDNRATRPCAGCAGLPLGSPSWQFTYDGNRVLHNPLTHSQPSASRRVCVLSRHRLRHRTFGCSRYAGCACARSSHPRIPDFHLHDDVVRCRRVEQSLLASHLAYCQLGFAHRATASYRKVFRSDSAFITADRCASLVGRLGNPVVLVQAGTSGRCSSCRSRGSRVHPCRPQLDRILQSSLHLFVLARKIEYPIRVLVLRNRRYSNSRLGGEL